MRMVGIAVAAMAAWASVAAAAPASAEMPGEAGRSVIAGPLLGETNRSATLGEGLLGGIDGALRAVIAMPPARVQPQWLAAEQGDGLGFHFHVQTKLDAWRRGGALGDGGARPFLAAASRFVPLRFQMPHFAPAALLGWSMQLASQLRVGIEAGAMTARMRAATLRDAVSGFGEGRRMAGGTGRVQLAMRF